MFRKRFDEIEPKKRGDGVKYEYELRPAELDGAKKLQAALFSIAPGRSNFPYHYHLESEELFYVLSGEGVLRSPEGESPVRAGDLLFFAPGKDGAHKLTNTGSEPLVYLDVDQVPDTDVCMYPDSRKIGVYHKDFCGIYRLEDEKDYYEGE